MAAPMSSQKIRKIAKFYLFLLSSSLIVSCEAWDNEDFELFDQVEEISQNFYELLGVKEDATSSEVRKAYRKLSLQLHPDKNPAEDAAVKFRQLVAVYETLKDEGRRQKYNNILVNGLPDWRQPIFYYRRVRKLGLAELGVLMFVIATIGQYLYKWAVYFERRLTIDDMVDSFRRKHERKSRKKAKASNDDPDAIEESLISQLCKPSCFELLPFQLYRLVKYLITDGPRLVLLVKELILEYRQQKQLEVEDSDSETEVVERVRVKPKRRVVTSEDDELYKQTATPVTYTPSVQSTGNQNSTSKVKTGEWESEDYILLSKAMTRFPGGTVQRWEKVAEFVGRPQAEVVAKSKTLKSRINTTVDPSIQGTTGAAVQVKKAKTALTDDMVTQRDNATSQSTPVTSSEPPSVTSSATSSVVWTQDEQKCLEWALAQYPKGTSERWEKVAAEISEKTKEQCMERFKHLAAMLKKKREQKSQKR